MWKVFLLIIPLVAISQGDYNENLDKNMTKLTTVCCFNETHQALAGVV